jgi:hypothetical protein
MVFFQNCVRQLRSSAKMAATVQLRCYQLSNWFQTRRFLCEFLGSYVKLSSAVGAILVEGPNCLTYFWKKTIQWLYPNIIKSWKCETYLKWGAWVAQWVRLLDLTTYTSLSPIRRGFKPVFVHYKTGWTRLAAACDKVYQLLTNLNSTCVLMKSKVGRKHNCIPFHMELKPEAPRSL